MHIVLASLLYPRVYGGPPALCMKLLSSSWFWHDDDDDARTHTSASARPDAKRVESSSLNEPASRKAKAKEAWAALEVTY